MGRGTLRPRYRTVSWPRYGLTAGEDGQYRIDAAQAAALFGIRNEDHFDIGFHGLIAAAFDHFGLDEIIDRRTGKVAHNVILNSGAGVRAMVMQLPGAPSQSLLNASAYFSKMPVGVLLRQPVQPEDPGRNVLSGLPDDIYVYGPGRLFTECPAQVLSVPGLKVTEAHIDSTGYHYDGKVKEDDECELKITHGYSRDYRPDLPQVILPGIVDGKSGIPLMTEAVSGNVNDNASFLKVMESRQGLREVMADPEYLVGDSPACTPDIPGTARANGIHVITRVPDKYSFVKKLFKSVKDEEFVPLYADEPDGSPGRWCGTAGVGDTELRLLMTDNEKLRPQKEQTVRRHAQKELEIETREERLVFEFKVTKTQADTPRLLNKAVTQIANRAYGSNLPTKTVIRYAVVISSAARKVSAIRVTKSDGTLLGEWSLAL